MQLPTINSETTLPVREHIKLSELNQKIKEVISNAFSDKTFWVVAEISSHKYYANNGWHYFNLVEKLETSKVEVAKINGKAWSEGAARIAAFEKSTGQKFTNGIQVLIKVKVEFHVVHELSLTLLDIDDSFTLGNLEKQRRETLLKLVADNPDFISLVDGEYITKNKSCKLPSVIQKIAVIASVNSQGFVDFEHTMKNNQYNYKFYTDYYYSTVQGVDAENSLIYALIKIFQSKNKYDAVVILRGGGAKTDFLVFDTYQLSRAVAKFPVPIITGIGHHDDVSIVDMMANTQMKTPTKAAEFIISRNRTFEEQVILAQKTIVIISQRIFSDYFQRLSTINSIITNKSRTILAAYKDGLTNFHQIVTNKTKSILFGNKSNLVSLANRISTKPKITISNKLHDLSNQVKNLESHTKTYFKSQRGYIGHFVSVVNMMHPKNILKKGFAIIYQDNTITSKPDKIKTGSDIKIRFYNSELISTVKSNKLLDGDKLDL